MSDPGNESNNKTDNTEATARPHRRYNPLNDSWVLVSPHRTRRPWQGQRETDPPDVVAYDPDCYLCPGNPRAEGNVNPDYSDVFVFDNDFPALLPNIDMDDVDMNKTSGLLQLEPVRGTCRVVCYSPRHDQTMAQLDVTAIRRVIDTWADQHRELGAQYRWVQIFENRGQSMGCSNPHPHGQIWATDHLPVEGEREFRQQQRYLESGNGVLLDRYAEHEHRDGRRVVIANDAWLVVVPWWAVWPFETLIIARHPVQRLYELDDDSRDQLATVLRTLCAGYDRLFDTPFPYSMGWHSAPGTEDTPSWRLHAHFYPPLLRSADIRKFMVGFELLAESQRDLTPEAACESLLAVMDSAAAVR